MHEHMHTYMQTYIHTYDVQMYTNMRFFKWLFARDTYMHEKIHTYMQIYIHAHIWCADVYEYAVLQLGNMYGPVLGRYVYVCVCV